MSDALEKKPSCSPREAANRVDPLDEALDVELFKALSDPTRARILAVLIKSGRRCSVTEVAEACHVDFSVVARHLAKLARAGALCSAKEGREVWYSPCCGDLAMRFRRLAESIAVWCPNIPNGGSCGGSKRS
ncbi:MAG: winged helix-turn-helix transcriptional regulator [Planctomycetes bacterium]|nr:winged helix-turn-helix transcriptional regulator [Planctomycetota bacterium]